jgi:hypothetical protein
MLFIQRDGMLPALISRPSTARYEALIRELVKCQNGLRRGEGDPLSITGYALASVIEFLHGDQGVMDSGITNALAVVMNALNDRRNGGRPRLLFDKRKSCGRPTNQAFDGVKAAAAMGLEVLLKHGLTRDQAGRYLAAQASKLGLRLPDGKEIGKEAVLRWRDEIDTAKSAIGAEVFKLLKARRASDVAIANLNQAKDIARGYLLQVQFAGFGVKHGGGPT